MAFLAAAAPYLAAAGTAVTVISAGQQAAAQRQQADAQAVALKNQANADAAASERQANNERRQGQYLMSRAQALAAASGAGATDPTVLNTEGQIAGQSEYNALTSIYEGGTPEQNALSAAQAARNTGRAARQAGTLNMISSGIGGVSRISTILNSQGDTTLATKYG